MVRPPLSPIALERGRAARVLLGTQAQAEGIRLAHEALALGLDALEPAARAEGELLLATARRPLRDHLVSRADVAAAERALVLLEDVSLPERRRGRNRALLGVLLLTVLAMGYYLFRPAPEIEAVASACYSSTPTHGARSVLDEDPGTNWLLPDRSTGWVELVFAHPRSVSSVEITNGHNPPYDDRAAGAIEVVLLGEGGAILASASHEFAFATSPSPERIEVSAEGVRRVRVYVRTFHRQGSALDAIRVQP